MASTNVVVNVDATEVQELIKRVIGQCEDTLKSAVTVGDTIWFFVELLKQMADEPNPVLVRVKEIRTDPDGTKMLVLERAV